MTDYTAPPTWEQIEAWWMSQPTAGVNEKWDRKANFDAWRREHDPREAAAKAWDEGLAAAGRNHFMARNGMIPNPYRDESAPDDAAPAGCPFDGAAHEFEQRFNYERQDYYDACRKCGHDRSE